MRILHTSDWHLGRSFHREDLLGAQAAYVDHLVDVVRSERVDLVVVSGDVYDRALPPVDAVQLAGEALRRLTAISVRVILTSGNHDSAPRLGFAADLIDAAGIHLRTDPAGVASPVVIPDAHGGVAVYGVPYLEPDLVRGQWRIAQRSHQAVLDEAMRQVRADLVRRPAGTRSVVLAHTFVAGARQSDSERDISVGGVASVALDTFDGVDYAALGHLHGRHTLSPRVRYSGSPLAYSFSEAPQRKGSWLVELGAAGLGPVEFVDAPVPRALALLRGSLEELLSDPRHTKAESAWVHATLTDARRPSQALERLRRRFPHTLVLKFEPVGVAPGPQESMADRVLGRSDAEIMARFFLDMRGSAPEPEEAALLRAACDSCRVAEDAAS
jgi:DNA repair protein SbcD/Mre11